MLQLEMKACVVTDPASLEKVFQLLRLNNLPYQDIRLESNLFIFYQDDESNLVGAGGLEFYGRYALLRSLVVDEKHRGLSYGIRITTDLLSRASAKGVNEIYLLTETAREFFLKNGFEEIPRDSTPPEIQKSSEFSSVCPVSAAIMAKRLV